MVDVVVFNILIPCTDDATGLVHPRSKFEGWVYETAERFGGVTVMGLALEGLWFDPQLPDQATRSKTTVIGTRSAWGRKRVDALREYVRETARSFGQKCLYFERAGEAEFVWALPFDSG